MKNLFCIRQQEKRLRYLPRYLLLLSFAVILATLPLGVSYYATLQSLESNIEQINQKSVQQIRDLCQEKLNEINNVIQQIGSNYLTNLMLNLDGVWAEADPQDIMSAQKYQEYLQNLKLPSDLILEIIIYSEKSGLVFKYNGSLPFSSWYGDSFAGRYFTLEEWQSAASQSRQGQLLPGCTYYTGGIPLKVIPYLQKLPLGSRRQLTGHVGILIDREKLMAGLVRSDTFESLWVLDGSGRLLASRGSLDGPDQPAGQLPSFALPGNKKYGSYTQILNGTPLLITFARSEDGLTFVTAAPYSQVFRPARTLKNVFYTMLVFCLLSLAASLLTFARKLSPPLKRLLSDNDALLSQLEEQKAEVRTSIISRLLTGCFGTREEIHSALESVDICWENYLWCAVCLRITEDTALCGVIAHKASDYLLVKARIRTLVQQYMDRHSRETSASSGDGRQDALSLSRYFVIDTGTDSLTLVCGTDKSACREEDFRSQLYDMICEIQNFLLPYRIYVPAGGGRLNGDMAELRISYEEALFAQKNNAPEGCTGLVWYRAQSSMPAFFYPAELEQRILLSAKCGDEPDLKDALSYIYHENYEKSSISLAAGELLMLRMKTTLLTACGEIPCPDTSLGREISAFVFREQSGHTAAQTYEQLQIFFLSLCRLAAEAQTEKQRSLHQKLLEFVNANCFDPNMSLTMAAGAFQLSENYVSSFFKEQTGINFLTYVENKRLQKSCRLLSGTSDTIDSIAFTAGYTSSHSFRRAFKRKFGVTPAKYREENGDTTDCKT